MTRCPHCGMADHDASDCNYNRFINPPPRVPKSKPEKVRTYGATEWTRCGWCTESGHDARLCPRRAAGEARVVRPRVNRCSRCTSLDHTARQCRLSDEQVTALRRASAIEASRRGRSTYVPCPAAMSHAAGAAAIVLDEVERPTGVPS